MVARWHLLSNRLQSNNEQREGNEGYTLGSGRPRESGFLFDAVMKTGQSGSVAWTHQRMAGVQSWMRHNKLEENINKKTKTKKTTICVSCVMTTIFQEKMKGAVNIPFKSRFKRRKRLSIPPLFLLSLLMI